MKHLLLVMEYLLLVPLIGIGAMVVTFFFGVRWLKRRLFEFLQREPVNLRERLFPDPVKTKPKERDVLLRPVYPYRRLRYTRVDRVGRN